MKRAIAIFAVLLVAAFASACEEKATDGAIQEMCKHLAKIGGEFDLTPVEVLVLKADKAQENKIKHLESKQAEALQVIDAESSQKFLTLKTEEEKTALKAEAEAAKVAKTAEFKVQIDALKAGKADEIKKVEKKAKDDAAAMAQSVDKCVAESKGTGVSKKIAQCRITAMNVEDYWKCR